MIAEDYVSYEIAKLLKKKGFEYNPDESYWLIDANNKMYWVSRIGAYDYVDTPTESFQRPKNGYRLITQAMAMKWLREVHNLLVVIDYNYECTSKSYCYKIYHLGKNGKPKKFPVYGIAYDDEGNANRDIISYRDFQLSYSEYTTYEEAVEAAIYYCLEYLI